MKNLNVLTIKALLNKKFYNANIDIIDKDAFPEEFREVLKSIQKAHDNSTGESIEVQHLRELYKLESTATNARKNNVKKFLDRVAKVKSIDEELIQYIIKKNYERAVFRSVADFATRAMVGGDHSLTELEELIEKASVMRVNREYDFCSREIEDLIRELEERGAFSFGNGLEFVQEIIPSPARGELMIVFAPPNAGKSTLAAQMDVGYLQAGFKVLYFVNEGPASKMMLNHIRSCQGISEFDIVEGDKIFPEWNNIKDNFFLLGAHGMTVNEIETAVEDIKPDVIVVDQADRISVTKKTDRHDLIIDQLYDKLRQMAAKYNALVVAVTQASSEGIGKLKLTQHNTSNSKIGKAANADLMLGIGMKDVEDDIRCINICKSKRGVHGSINCRLNAEIARYEQA